MIIWGSTGRDTNCGYGHFFCPGCRSNSDYAHQRVQRYFTLYFIPLFPMSTLGEYVQCSSCGSQYDVKITEIPPEQIRAMTQPWTCGRCGNNNPAEYGECLSCKSSRSLNASSQSRSIAAGAPPRIGADFVDAQVIDDDVIDAESA